MSVESEPDLVWGAKAIGVAINRNERQTFHMLEAGRLPARKVAGRWVGSRKKLLAHVTGDNGEDK
ncbi:DNA-binding protein [Mesorhizobium sp. IMUNJ 23232]|uniref:DNA-binding protein n=1 Tax=Mesorhizobium sp. IMUNJ 23232 TaxID=3376064 RepID=UPI0037BA2CD3